MNNKKYKNIILGLGLSFFGFYGCKSQIPGNNQQTVSVSQPVDLVNVAAEIADKRVENDLSKSVHKFVLEARRAGILDEDTAKILMTYSILGDISTEEAQKFLVAAELAGLSNQTRAIDFNSYAAASNKSSSGERFAWICCCSVLVGVICLLIYDRSHYGVLDGAKRDLIDAMHRADRSVRSFLKR